jgi:hypothetical protein
VWGCDRAKNAVRSGVIHRKRERIAVHGGKRGNETYSIRPYPIKQATRTASDSLMARWTGSLIVGTFISSLAIRACPSAGHWRRTISNPPNEMVGALVKAEKGQHF